jgi:N-acetylmuramoyl-L-alanine amidase
LARLLKDDLVKQIGFPDFGSRFQNLALTRPSGMLAVLTETGFVVSPDEYAQLISDAGQEKAAQGMVTGLIEYLGRGAVVKRSVGATVK